MAWCNYFLDRYKERVVVMDWFALVNTLGPGGVAIGLLLTYLFALGVYKLVKDWLPF